MHSPAPLEPVDYLVIGNLTCDLTPAGPRIGGTAAYSALTAHALGLRAGIVTAWGGEVALDRLDGIQVVTIPAEHSTTFENLYTAAGRVQYLHHVAPALLLDHVPAAWRQTPIVHIGPVAQEAKALVDGNLASALLGLTPQGWMRTWDGDRRVRPCAWPEAAEMLSKAGAAVVSLEDVGGDEEEIEAMALACRILAVTEGPAGARLYWKATCAASTPHPCPRWTPPAPATSLPRPSSIACTRRATPGQRPVSPPTWRRFP